MDLPAIQKALHEALGTGAQTLAPLSAATPKPAAALVSAAVAIPAAVAVAAAPASPPVDAVNLDNFFDT